ncbi:MAG: sarcosine oxidase subunit delta [Rhizobiales bacterium]|nr:sarcosine oxidase subunit delta [Hyphomicrobiales bacterium]
MLVVPCPFCGERNESEFVNAGPSRPRRPDDPNSHDAAAWVDYLTVPENPMGPVLESWWHMRGCGMWFKLTRDTVTHQILVADAGAGAASHEA